MRQSALWVLEGPAYGHTTPAKDAATLAKDAATPVNDDATDISDQPRTPDIVVMEEDTDHAVAAAMQAEEDALAREAEESIDELKGRKVGIPLPAGYGDDVVLVNMQHCQSELKLLRKLVLTLCLTCFSIP